MDLQIENKMLAFPNQKEFFLVCLSANNVNEAPACSKAPQKKITKKAKKKITVILCVSILDQTFITKNE
jgi:hypothetical protein